MKAINLEVIKDPRERRWVQRIIELTEEGEIEWDFSRYIDRTRMYPIEAEYKGFFWFLSVHDPDGANFVIYHGKKGLRLKLLEFCRPATRALRNFLVELAEEDPEVKRQRREKVEGIGVLEAHSSVRERERARRLVDEVLGW